MSNTEVAATDPHPQAMPQVTALAQYVKRLSFDNMNAPQSLAPTPAGQQPTIGVQVNINSTPVSPTDFEVALRLEGKAELPDLLLFKFELIYAGAFRIQNVSPEALQPIVLIECPRLLFPFAREIIASTCANGGFSPLLLAPFDFVGLYHQRLAATAQAAAA